MKLTTKQREIVDQILDKFDFTKTWVAMNSVGWTYWDSSGTPTKDNLRNTAQGLLETVVSGGSDCTMTGGFIAQKREGEVGSYYELSFQLASSDNEYPQ